MNSVRRYTRRPTSQRRSAASSSASASCTLTPRYGRAMKLGPTSITRACRPPLPCPTGSRSPTWRPTRSRARARCAASRASPARIASEHPRGDVGQLAAHGAAEVRAARAVSSVRRRAPPARRRRAARPRSRRARRRRPGSARGRARRGRPPRPPATHRASSAVGERHSASAASRASRHAPCSGTGAAGPSTRAPPRSIRRSPISSAAPVCATGAPARSGVSPAHQHRQRTERRPLRRHQQPSISPEEHVSARVERDLERPGSAAGERARGARAQPDRDGGHASASSSAATAARNGSTGWWATPAPIWPAPERACRTPVVI